MLYHVNGQDIDADSPGALLNQLHQKLVAKYKNKAMASIGSGGSSADAKLLQTFLSNWKKYANTGTVNKSSPFTTAYFEQLQARFPPGVRNLFRFNTSGGRNFEKELGTFIYSVLESSGYSSGENAVDFVSKINVGGGAQNYTSNVKFGADMVANLEKFAKTLVQNAGNVVEENLKQMQERAAIDAQKILGMKNPGLKGVQRKTDLSTKSVTFTIDPTITLDPQTEKVISLLSKATITAKNYGTTKWVENFRKDHGWDIDAISLGDANMFRSVLSVLVANGFESSFATSLMCAAYTIPDTAALAHFAHLRFIYELTGEGQVIKNEITELTNAEYFIWNDYTSDAIIVKSTAELIMDLFNGVMESDLNTHVNLNYRMWRSRFTRKGYYGKRNNI